MSTMHRPAKNTPESKILFLRTSTTFASPNAEQNQSKQTQRQGLKAHLVS
jgi:hypothetical protein